MKPISCSTNLPGRFNSLPEIDFRKKNVPFAGRITPLVFKGVTKETARPPPSEGISYGKRICNVEEEYRSASGKEVNYMTKKVLLCFMVLNATLLWGGGSSAATASVQETAEPLGPSSRRGAMVISEIMIDSPTAWGGTNSLEFIELYNTGLITEDLTGHRFSGEIDYTFPDGAALAPGAFMVIAKDPAAAQRFYGISCMGPYEGKLSNSGGTLRFRNELNGILLEVEYDHRAPWPAAAFGTGHSMVLSHPSYGEKRSACLVSQRHYRRIAGSG